jgi:hypothetical protein
MAKYTYIKQDIKGYYIEFDEMFNPDLYNNLGETWDDFLDNKWVLLSDEQVAFHEEHPTASVKEVWDMELTPEPIYIRTLEDAKNEMIANIDAYDSSINVNGFTVNNEIEAWFTADERSNYKSSIDAAKLLGVDTLSFFINDIEMTLPTESVENMLAQIQLYADQCYIVTKQHKLDVNALETIEEVDAYPYMNGYPQRLNFDVATLSRGANVIEEGEEPSGEEPNE